MEIFLEMSEDMSRKCPEICPGKIPGTCFRKLPKQMKLPRHVQEKLRRQGEKSDDQKTRTRGRGGGLRTWVPECPRLSSPS